MKLYFAGAESDLKNLDSLGVERLLITIAHGKNKIKNLHEIYNRKFDLVMDSGAFTYHKKGGISIDEWLNQVDMVKHNVNEIISLDVIGNAEKTYSNFIEIRKHIDNVIPTFHVGSSIEWLKKYLNYTDRIAIGGIVTHGVNRKSLFTYLDEIFSIVDRNNIPRLHAFGVFNQKILERYPFYSCDASSWNSYAKFDEFEIIDKFIKRRAKSIKKNVKLEKYLIDEIIGNMANERIEKLRISVGNFLFLEKFLTKLWKERGIEWQ